MLPRIAIDMCGGMGAAGDELCQEARELESGSAFRLVDHEVKPQNWKYAR